MDSGATNRGTVEAVEARRGYGDFASGKNVGDIERVVSVIAGTALALFGLRRFSLTRLGLAGLGGSLIYRGLTGYCSAYARAGVSTAEPGEGVRGNLGTKIERSIVIYAPADRIFRFWHNFANLPRFMDNIESVQVRDPRHSHWVARGPGGVRVEWDAEIINEIPDELIAWRSTGGHVDHAGSVRFAPGPGGRGTEVRVSLQYDPPGGSAGHAVATLLGGDAGSLHVIQRCEQLASQVKERPARSRVVPDLIRQPPEIKGDLLDTGERVLYRHPSRIYPWAGLPSVITDTRISSSTAREAERSLPRG